MNAPLSRYLIRFPEIGLTKTEPVSIAALEPELRAPLVAMDPVDYEARIESARLETDRRSAIRHAEEIAALRAAHQDELTQFAARTQAERSAEVNTATAAMIDKAFADLRETICEQVAEVLRPLLSEGLVARARAAVTDALDQLLTDADRPSIVVRGPADALTAIRAARSSTSSIEFIVTDSIEVTVTAGETMIETKLGAALSMLERDDR